jgi:streptogramin lyase
MRFKLVAVAAGIALALAWAILAWASMAQAGNLKVEEANLTPGGEVYEVNPDAQGDLYISDSGAGEIWQVDPGGAYTVYEVAWPVVDAKADSAGDIWFTDAAATFGRIAAGGYTLTTWTLAGAQNLGGLAFDSAGHVWLSQSFGSDIYRFDPTTTEVCTYTVGAPSDYIVYRDEALWLGNWGSDRIYQLDLVANQVTWWQLVGGNARPVGMAMDEEGALWWTDTSLGVLARLEPLSNRMTTYALPTGTKPQMIAIRPEGIWYTENGLGTVGVMDPSVTTGVSTTLATTTSPTTADCDGLGVGVEASITTRTGNLAWAEESLPPIVDANGWKVYQPAIDSSPYGIAASGGYLWATDQGRQKLLRLYPPRGGRLGLGVSPSSTGAFHGEVITYTYTITYTSDDGSAANTIAVVDDTCAPVIFAGGDGNGDSKLDVTETWVYTCTYTLPPHTDGETNPLVDSATASGLDANGLALAPDQQSASVAIWHRAGTLTVVKSGPATAYHGQTIAFDYEVTYASEDNAPAQNVQVGDDKCDPVAFVAGDADADGRLDVGESWTYACQYAVPEHTDGEEDPIVNTATVTAQDMDGDAVVPDSDQHATDIWHETFHFVYLPIMLRPTAP